MILDFKTLSIGIMVRRPGARIGFDESIPQIETIVRELSPFAGHGRFVNFSHIKCHGAGRLLGRGGRSDSGMTLIETFDAILS